MPQQLSPPLIDSHVHTDDDRLESQLNEALAAARSANIVAQIVPSISYRFWPRVKALCADNDDLFACYGLHPCFQGEHTGAHIEQLALWISKEHPVAVGECGLDYFINGADKKNQQQLFAAQLSLASEFNLPVVVHARKAVEDVIGLIRSSGHRKGVIHSFNGSREQADRLIDLGYKLGFGGAATYTRATKLRSLLASLPLDALLLETDAPDQVDAKHVGQLNVPANLVDIWQAVSELRNETPDQVAARTTANAKELFGLSV